MTPDSTAPDTARMSTRPVHIGGVVVGGDAPIVLQSMTTADTMDASLMSGSIGIMPNSCEE